jgi:para-aminobenzoate synthetase/4-amino-4-deoxychorismate lyase
MVESFFIISFEVPVIQTGEVLLKSNDQWLYFSKPRKILTTEKLDEVRSTLHELEKAVFFDNLFAAGFLSYEAAPAFDSALRVLPVQDFPLVWFGLYPKPTAIFLPTPPDLPTINWEPTVGQKKYNAAIKEIKEKIANGRTYQVNYTMRLLAKFYGDPWDFFLHLVQSQNRYAAYVNTGQYVICSASPELFFELDGDVITGRPMKGTVKRGRTTSEDAEQAKWLHADIKNRAENVMIVDMIRNDIGRIAEIGTVHVPELFTIEQYPTLFQMTSTVKAKTKATILDIFSALFPCASITGAPKVSTMKIIADLESTPRRIYTGSIGFISPERKAQFNVAIRTALIDIQKGQAEYGVGGGIVWDSTSTDEYAEAILKARVLTEQTPNFSLLETMLWTPEEGFFLREKHIARLLDSACYFDFPVSKGNIEETLDRLASNFDSPNRIRFLMDREGNITTEYKKFEPQTPNKALIICLAKKPIHSGNVFLYHKTTQRQLYDSALKDFPEYDDILLYNEHDELTEFTVGNLVVEIGGRLLTPPRSCGLLPGTFRAQLLESGHVKERVIRVEELKDCTKIFLVNSVRKWQNAEIKR